MQNHRLPCLLLILFPSAGGYWRLQRQVHSLRIEQAARSVLSALFSGIRMQASNSEGY